MTDIPEQELPGMWSHSDFEGGDQDTRSYAQRARDAEAAGDTKTADFWRAKIAGPEVYYPKRLSAHDRQVNCQCMCHEAGPATSHGPGEKCPCKVGGWHRTDDFDGAMLAVTTQQHNINVARRQPGGL